MLVFVFTLFSFSEIELSNQNLKNRLIETFGNETRFSYAKDERKSQVYFSRYVQTTELVEIIRSQDVIKDCARILKNECIEYKFSLEDSYKDANDVIASYNIFIKKRPAAWECFFNTMLPFRKTLESLQRKSDTIFQIMYSLTHNSTKKTPLQIFVAEPIHDISRSKRLINIMNQLGVSTSYKEMLGIDNIAAKRIIQMNRENRVPVAKSMKHFIIIQGAMDDFDHDEATKSGIKGSHDTVLMLFQNHNDEERIISDQNYISIMPNSAKSDENKESKKALNHVLPCQFLSKASNLGERGEISGSFAPSKQSSDLQKKSSRKRFLIWSTARSNIFTSGQNEYHIPSFVSVNSFFLEKVSYITRFAHTPIIPHLATEYDTIHTAMKNFQDVPLQRGLDYGPLWCNDGVYRIGKEVQLLHPNLHDSIFLGRGGFHMEKHLIACCGSYLKDTGIDNIFVENEIFSPGVLNSVMSGGNYIRDKRGMLLIAEKLQQLQYSEFSTKYDTDIPNHELNDFQKLFSATQEENNPD